MNRLSGTAFGLAMVSAACAHPRRPEPGQGVHAVAVPNGAPGIGFDDLRYASDLHRVLVPAGRSGALALVGGSSASVSVITGFSSAPTYDGGHDFGATSADAREGLVFVTDRTAQTLSLVDPAKMSILSSTPLASGPDYVRWAGKDQIWVTEPDREQIEVFRLVTKEQPPKATPVATIQVAGGPESLAIDATRKRAYTHLWAGATVAIDLATRGIVETWPNGCGGSRGIALDEPAGFLLVGCAEGAAVVLDVKNHGAIISKLSQGDGVDVIDFNPQLSHLYLPGAKSASLAILGVSAQGELTLLGTFATAPGAHCVAADDQGNAFVCDPSGGRLLQIKDSYPASRTVTGHGAGFHHPFKDASSWARVFDAPDRDAWQKPKDVVAAMAIAPGMVVADLGAGTGYFLPYLSRAVGDQGRVLALDIEPDMVAHMTARAEHEKLGNVVAQLVKPDDPGLPPESVDRVLIVDTWHHIDARPGYATKLRAALRPGGTVTIVDFTLESSHGPPKEHRLRPEVVLEELAQGGLRAEVLKTALPDQYVVRGTRRAE
jgi:SAM-dependent methyltransferase